MADPRLTKGDVEKAFGAPAEFLGGGSFGDTWCIDGRAEKILCGDPVDTDRFDREVEALSRLDHDRVVALHEVRVVTISGTDYRVMGFEYVAGGDAAAKISAGDLVAGTDVRALLVGLLEAAAALHDVRVVHRDIKPANVILRGGVWSDPVLCDLGLARLDDQSSITRYPAQVGTAPYMAPEQLVGRRARKGAARCGIGIVVREAIAGRHPFFNAGDRISPAAFGSGPVDLPEGLDPQVAAVLDDLTSVQRHRRGTARSNLRRME